MISGSKGPDANGLPGGGASGSGVPAAGSAGANNGETGHKQAGDPLGTNSEIGRKLKQYFDGVVSEGVPDRFAQLLSQLERAEPAAASSRSEG